MKEGLIYTILLAVMLISSVLIVVIQADNIKRLQHINEMLDRRDAIIHSNMDTVYGDTTIVLTKEQLIK